MGDPLMQGARHLQMEAELEVQKNQQRKEASERQRLVTKGDFLKVINSDEVMKGIRLYIQSQYDSCLNQLLSPKLSDINAMTLLKGELQAHQKYLEMFSIWESEGKAALKKLLDQEKAGKNGE